MAAYNKFNLFTQDLVNGIYNFTSDVFKIMLTNTAPVATNHVYADVSGTELANGAGYLTGGTSSAVTLGNASGTETVTATAVTFTATGSLGPFRYAIFYDTTPAGSVVKPLTCWFDYGSSITLASGETFIVEPNSSATTGTLFTLV